MAIAEEFRDHAIYFPYNMDFRGRTYPLPPNLNILGSDFCRGILMFDEARPLGERGLYWLKVFGTWNMSSVFAGRRSSGGRSEKSSFVDVVILLHCSCVSL